jgi:hypothetical protein
VQLRGREPRREANARLQAGHVDIRDFANLDRLEVRRVSRRLVQVGSQQAEVEDAVIVGGNANGFRGEQPHHLHPGAG